MPTELPRAHYPLHVLLPHRIRIEPVPICVLQSVASKPPLAIGSCRIACDQTENRVHHESLSRGGKFAVGCAQGGTSQTHGSALLGPFNQFDQEGFSNDGRSSSVELVSQTQTLFG